MGVKIIGAIRKNNFDIIRLILALLVVFTHASELTTASQLSFFNGEISAFAVKGFFVISGFLVYMSYSRSQNMNQYFLKRATRIYPAYICMLAIIVFVGVAITIFPIEEYLIGAIKYFIANILFLNFLCPSLPGVFTSNSYPNIVNGALWTLKVEIMFYFCVPIIFYIVRKLKTTTQITSFLLAIYILSYFYVLITNNLFLFSQNRVFYMLAHQIPGQMSYFVLGIFFYLFPKYCRSQAVFALSCVGYYLCLYGGIFALFMQPFFVGYIIIFLVFNTKHIPISEYIGDISYGIYIWHFPLIQMFVSSGLLKYNFMYGFTALVVMIFTFGIFSWKYIESPMLIKKTEL